MAEASLMSNESNFEPHLANESNVEPFSSTFRIHLKANSPRPEAATIAFLAAIFQARNCELLGIDGSLIDSASFDLPFALSFLAIFLSFSSASSLLSLEEVSSSGSSDPPPSSPSSSGSSSASDV
jgi:hypothetical protein